jgi:hypothetical protein
VDFEVSVVVDIAQLPKLIHEVADAGPRGADHVRECLLADFSDHRLPRAQDRARRQSDGWHDDGRRRGTQSQETRPGRSSAVEHCGDTYKVATADGKIRDFWERNLRFKTDVSDDGPQKGQPALVGAGMMGDRADVIFAGPGEISGFIAHQC